MKDEKKKKKSYEKKEEKEKKIYGVWRAHVFILVRQNNSNPRSKIWLFLSSL
jgi:hypothetical protein